MTVLSASAARSNLYKLIDEVKESSEPIIISGKRNNAVLVSEEDWEAIQETLYLSAIPGVKDSIIKGMKEPLSKSVKDPDW